jgi:hypothetical protein
MLVDTVPVLLATTPMVPAICRVAVSCSLIAPAIAAVIPLTSPIVPTIDEIASTAPPISPWIAATWLCMSSVAFPV